MLPAWVKPWVIISEIHFTCNLSSLIKVALIVATKDLHVLQVAPSVNKLFA